MKIFRIKSLSTMASVLLLVTFGVKADIYNHGNHDDPPHDYATGSIITIDCGNLSLSTCASIDYLRQVATRKCESMISPYVGDRQAPPYNQSYYHSAQSFNESVLSVIDLNYGQGHPHYQLDLKFNCRALYHEVEPEKLEF